MAAAVFVTGESGSGTLRLRPEVEEEDEETDAAFMMKKNGEKP
jgi:hypothetical protein